MLLNEKSLICLCNFCRNWLWSERAKAGELVNCPYCLMETVLYTPDGERPYPLSRFPLELRKLAWDISHLGHRCIRGEIANCSQSDLDWARVEFSLFSSSDVVIGGTSDCLLKFAAGQSWKFSAPVFDCEAVRASMPALSTEYGRVGPEDRLGVSSMPKPAAPALQRSRYS